MNVSMPDGIRNIAIINSLLIAWYILKILLFSSGRMGDIVFYTVVIFLLLITGPLLMARSVMIWRVARPLLYVAALVVAYMFLVSLVKEKSWINIFNIVINLVLVLYFIGVRGFLNQSHIRVYYGVDQMEAVKKQVQ